jgi:hypothetical protein
MEVSDDDGSGLVTLPPDLEQIGGGLATPVPLLGLADPLGGILAAERQQRIAHPLTPLLEAAQGAPA